MPIQCVGMASAGGEGEAACAYCFCACVRIAPILNLVSNYHSQQYSVHIVPVATVVVRVAPFTVQLALREPFDRVGDGGRQWAAAWQWVVDDR